MQQHSKSILGGGKKRKKTTKKPHHKQQPKKLQTRNHKPTIIQIFLMFSPSSNSAGTVLAHTAPGTDMITLLDHTPQPHKFT